MSACLVLAPFDAEDEPVPHADLVRAPPPDPVQVTEAAGVLGLLPDGSYLSGQIRIRIPV